MFIYRRSLCAVSIFFIFLAPFTNCINTQKKLYQAECFEPNNAAENMKVTYTQPDNVELIGELFIRYDAGFSRERALEKLKQDAADCGADGLILTETRTSDSYWNLTQGDANYSTTTRAKAYEITTIMYRYRRE